MGWKVIKVTRVQNMRWKTLKYGGQFKKKRLEIVYHETTIIAPHLFRFLCVIWIFFTSPAAKSYHRSPIFWFILASLHFWQWTLETLTALLRIFCRQVATWESSKKESWFFLRKMSVGSKNLCFSSDLHTGLRMCPQNCSFILRCQEEAEWEWFWIILIQTNKQTKHA